MESFWTKIFLVLNNFDEVGSEIIRNPNRYQKKGDFFNLKTYIEFLKYFDY